MFPSHCRFKNTRVRWPCVLLSIKQCTATDLGDERDELGELPRFLAGLQIKHIQGGLVVAKLQGAQGTVGLGAQAVMSSARLCSKFGALQDLPGA